MSAHMSMEGRPGAREAPCSSTSPPNASMSYKMFAPAPLTLPCSSTSEVLVWRSYPPVLGSASPPANVEVRSPSYTPMPPGYKMWIPDGYVLQYVGEDAKSGETLTTTGKRQASPLAEKGNDKRQKFPDWMVCSPEREHGVSSKEPLAPSKKGKGVYTVRGGMTLDFSAL